MSSPSDWRDDVAVRVDELAQNSVYREHWWSRLLEWKSWRGAETASSSPAADEEKLWNDGLLPRRALTLLEEYAWLAAIHDTRSEGLPLAQWDQPTWELTKEPVKEVEEEQRAQNLKAVKQVLEGVPFQILCSDVKRLEGQEEQRRIEAALRDVEADLLRLLPVESAPAPPDEAGQSDGYTMSQLADAAKVSADTVADYADKTGVSRPGPGGRNHRFTRDETRKILIAMSQSTTKKTRDNAAAAMKTLLGSP